MQFVVKRDILLKSLNFVQGVIEKKNTLPILSNVLLQLKSNKLSIVATDLDIIFYDEITDVKILKEGNCGGIIVIDLANINSCAFIATQDLGKMHKNGLFELLGRFDQSDIRGCNLMVV